MLLGAHESASGGLTKAITRAEDDGCESVQIFVKNNNRWSQRAWTDSEIQAFRDAYAASSLSGLVAHAGYLINLCSNKPENVRKSIDALADELTRCARLGVPYLVMHPGSHLGQGEPEGLALIARNLREVYAREEDWGEVTLLFENTAGQGTNLGWRLSHLGELFDLVEDPARFGVCFDTCHAHASGYDLTQRASYESFWDEFDAVVGLERLRAFHLNDSKRALGSRKDRHEHIGQGEIGLETFRWLVNDARFTGTPAVVETPSLEDGTPGFAHNIEVLKALR